MKKRKNVFKRVSYLLMIISLITVAFSAPIFIEKEVNSANNTVTKPIITKGNWTVDRQYVFTANEPIAKYSLDGGAFIAIDPPVGDEYTIPPITNNHAHTLVLKDNDEEESIGFSIQKRNTSDTFIYYASKGMLPWEFDTEPGDGIDFNWEYSGTGSITSDIFDADGNCIKEYGEGAICYKTYDLEVDGEQIKVLQQLDDSRKKLKMERDLTGTYNNLKNYGGNVRGTIIVPSGGTAAGIGDPNTGTYADTGNVSGGAQRELESGGTVTLKFENIPGRPDKRLYKIGFSQAGEYVKLDVYRGNNKVLYSRILNGDKVDTLGDYPRKKNLPTVKVGDPLEFVLSTRGAYPGEKLLRAATLTINGINVGQIKFRNFYGTGNNISISSGNGTNRALIIQNFGIQINTADIDILAPISQGVTLVNNPIYTFLSNENILGYQVNDEDWETINPSSEIEISLNDGLNDLRVRDRAGNIATYQVQYIDITIPTINPINGATVNIGDASSWTTPKATANDNVDGDISGNIVVTYFNADETIEFADEDAAKIELGAGRNIVVKYNVSDTAGNPADEVSATFTAVTPEDTTAPVIDPVDDATVNIGDASSWTTPTATANDNVDGDISGNIVVTYYKADGTVLLDEDAAKLELGAGRNIVVKYNVSDAKGNPADEVSATFTAVAPTDTTPPVITSSGLSRTFDYTITVDENISWYSIDNGATWTQVTTPSDNVAITFPANGVYKIIVKDVAGNESVMRNVRCMARR